MSTTRVDKPWGHEIRWVTTDRYAGKLLFIKAGHQLSLQFHRRKDEAFWVQEGELELVLGRGPDRRVERLRSGEHRHLAPGTVHRFRAVSDCLLFEVSTPELDDVVRLEDDFGRAGGDDGPGSTSSIT